MVYTIIEIFRSQNAINCMEKNSADAEFIVVTFVDCNEVVDKDIDV